MKKNVEKVVRLRGFAEANGVAMEAGLAAGIDTFGNIGKFVTVKEDGNLVCKDYAFDYDKTQIVRKIQNIGRFLRCGLLILAAICMICFFIGAARDNWGFSLSYIFLGLSMISDALVIAFGRLVGLEDFVSFSKFEAAKNAVLNYYADNKQIPNINVIKNAERVDRGLEPDFVGTAGLASTLIVLGIARLLPGTLFVLVAVLWLIACITGEPKRSKKIWQYFLVTSEPEEIHYKAAILAAEEAMKWTENAVVKVSQAKLSKEDFVAKIGHVFDEEKCLNCEHFKECKKAWENLDEISAEIYVCEVRKIDEGGKE